MLNFIFPFDAILGTYQNLAAQGGCKGEAKLVEGLFVFVYVFTRLRRPHNVSFQPAVEESTRIGPDNYLASVSPDE